MDTNSEPKNAAYIVDSASASFNLPLAEKKAGIAELMDKEMTGKKFLKISSISVLVLILLTVSVHFYFDIYGLFRPVKGRSIKVIHNERVSKYLLSYRYIPHNFDAAILGTSLSDNLDVSAYNEQQQNPKFRIYNASVMGANISEISPIAKNLVDGNVKRLVICFSPYLVKDAGFKEVEFNQKLYYGALGSRNLYETYMIGFFRRYGLFPDKFPREQHNEYGVNTYNSLLAVKDVKAKIERVIKADRDENLSMDPVAYTELKEMLSYLKEHNVAFVGYFHPVPTAIYLSKKDDFDKFEQTVRELVGDDSRLIDFTEPQYRAFTDDYSNYIDHSHLSYKGQRVITDTLLHRLERLP